MLAWLARLDSLDRRIESALGASPRNQAQAAKAHPKGSPRRPEAPVEDLPLLDFVPRVSPRWERPEHLSPLAELFERAETEEVRALVSVPPQHGKTELELHGIARYLKRHPERTAAFASYSASFARSKSRFARDYALAAGVVVRQDSKALDEWRILAGGGLLATGVGGPLTGQGVQLLLVDDPHKNREEAESLVLRNKVHGWFTSTAMTRIHPGASVIVCHTRWHEDDLIGRLSKERQADGTPRWEYHNLPAINASGEALWPQRRPLSFLEGQRDTVGPYDWWSLYMGSPRPRGSSVFGDVHHFTELPKSYRVAIGVDFAYTAKSKADWSVAVVLAYGADASGRMRFYVLDVRRRQVTAPVFMAELRQLTTIYPGARMFTFVAGPEKGVVDFIKRENVPIDSAPATADKFVRAQPVAAAWNAGDVLLPQGSAWAPAFVSVLASFTGEGDVNDDDVDALAAAHSRFAKATTFAFSDNFPSVRSRV